MLLTTVASSLGGVDTDVCHCAHGLAHLLQGSHSLPADTCLVTVCQERDWGSLVVCWCEGLLLKCLHGEWETEVGVGLRVGMKEEEALTCGHKPGEAVVRLSCGLCSPTPTSAPVACMPATMGIVLPKLRLLQMQPLDGVAPATRHCRQ